MGASACPAVVRREVEREALLRVAAAVAGTNDFESVLELAAEEARLAVGAYSTLGDNPDLAAITLATGTQRLITNEPGNERSPSWQPK